MSAPGDGIRNTSRRGFQPPENCKPASGPIHHAARRLAELIVSIIDSDEDPTTLERWGELATPSMSCGSVRGLCYAAGVKPKDTLAFTRVLRAVHLASTGRWSVSEFIDARDVRTVRRLLERSGVGPDIGVDRFMRTQQFIENEAVLQEVAALVSSLRSR